MLVVLPLENLGAPDDEYFADGLSEAITTRLGTVPSLGVIARQSAMGYKKTTKSPQAIGKELGVEYILAGTVRWEKSARRPNRVRVSTALMRAVDANQVWARQYDTVLAGVFDVESNLAERVAGALDVALGAPEREALSMTPTREDRKSTRLNSSHGYISYAVFCLKKKKKKRTWRKTQARIRIE